MTCHLHHLTGCAPAPLAHYLKALGVLRLVAEQADPTARGWWQDEHFCLLSRLDRDAIERFFLEQYEPTALVSPWNRGSGFYGTEDPGLAPIARSIAPRFGRFREGIGAARRLLDSMVEAAAAVRAIKDRTKAKSGMTAAQKSAAAALKNDPEFKRELAAAERRFKQMKGDLLTPMQRDWRGSHRRWLDAAIVILDDGRAAWPSLLGTGGADGRLDFTNNAMQRIGELFDLSSPSGAPTPPAPPLLASAMWGSPCNGLSVGAAVGQFFPGSAGGANSTTAADGMSTVNAWDFVLMLEGAVLFAGRATRVLDPGTMSRANAPFAVRSHRTGYGSGGREKADRGEQWMPVWSRPTTLSDLEAMLGEARVQLGRQIANRPIDVARAVARLGVARGVAGFARYGFLERNGQSNIAVPLGRISVTARPRARLVDDLAPWLSRLERSARDEHSAALLTNAERRLADAVFAALTHDDSAGRWQTVLAEAAQAEAVIGAGTAVRVGPIPPLDPAWLTGANDGSIEWRLACALASSAATYRRGRPEDSVRHHWMPLAPGARRLAVRDLRLVDDPRVVVTGRDPYRDLAAVVERRLVEAAQRGQRRLPLVAAPGFEAAAEDVGALVADQVDLERVCSLARALMALRWDTAAAPPAHHTVGTTMLDEAFVALRLASLPWPLHGISIPVEPAIVRRLVSGDAPGAVELALRRLRAAGLNPPMRASAADPCTAARWAAALAFPLSYRTALTLARRFAFETGKETR